MEFYYCPPENRSRACLEHKCATCGTADFYWSQLSTEIERNGGDLEYYYDEPISWSQWIVSDGVSICDRKSGEFSDFISQIIEWISRKKPQLHIQGDFINLLRFFLNNIVERIKIIHDFSKSFYQTREISKNFLRDVKSQDDDGEIVSLADEETLIIRFDHDRLLKYFIRK